MRTVAEAPENGATFFRNVDCMYFPCHEGIDTRQFNCLFCYCPLYPLGPRCGGDYRYTENGIKDCTACTRLHRGTQGVDLVKERFPLLADLARNDAGDRATGNEASS